MCTLAREHVGDAATDRSGTAEHDAGRTRQGNVLRQRSHGGGGRGVAAGRVEHDGHADRTKERTLYRGKQFLRRPRIVAANENRGVGEIGTATREHRTVNQRLDTGCLDVAVAEQVIHTGIHGDHRVKRTRLGIDIKLQENFS